jgi:dolichyl-phosphate-mannose--protein O-mannosyl transferase
LINQASASRHEDDDGYERSVDHEKVTCGSAIKLTSVAHGYKLHSHEVQYATGSRQQSVTGFPDSDDSNSYFLVQGSLDEVCQRGQAVKCGQVVRFKHMNTGLYLHSHTHRAPMSGNQEVSAYIGQDSGDHWKLLCTESHSYWVRDEEVRLQHVDTSKYLYSSKDFVFRHPIPGQLEVSAAGFRGSARELLWMAEEGIYFSDNPKLS